MKRCCLWLLAVILTLAAPAGPDAAAHSRTYTDPFTYCEAVGTIDQPDDRYRGPAVPAVIAEGLRAAFGLGPEHPLEPFMRATSWRCMEGKVYACTVGANIPCMEKADTGTRPSQGMIDYCRAEPEADAIPVVVTGRTTIYLWSCQAGKPQILRQVYRPDARGFLSDFWHEIKPQ